MLKDTWLRYMTNTVRDKMTFGLEIDTSVDSEEQQIFGVICNIYMLV